MIKLRAIIRGHTALTQVPGGRQRRRNLLHTAATLIVLSGGSDTAEPATVNTAIAEEVTVFRDAFIASDFSGVDELIAQRRKSGKPLPQDPDGKTLLHYAIQIHSSDRARMLLKAGVDVNARAWEDATPLHFAARFDCSACAQELIAAGAKVNSRDKDGWSPIFQASDDLLPILLKAGADMNIRDHDGNLPLHRNFKRQFIVAGVDVNARNVAGLTPLHFAALGGNLAALQMLVDNGADLSARTTALYWYRAASVSSSFGKGEEVPARSTALALAKLQFDRTKWNTSRHKPAVELPQKLERNMRK
jgi:ankyrin repeat protein